MYQYFISFFLKLFINYETLSATEREIKVQYRSMAWIYHPDKYDSSTNFMTKEHLQDYFKLINNAYEYLRNL